MDKRLMHGDRVIGDYPSAWEPPEGSDIHAALKDGSMCFVEAPQVRLPSPPPRPTIEDVIAVLSDEQQRAIAERVRRR